jgi:hypothetical protein
MKKSLCMSICLVGALLQGCVGDPGAPESDVDDGVADSAEVVEALSEPEVAVNANTAAEKLQGVLVPQSNQPLQALYVLGAKEWLRWVMDLPWSTGPVTDTTGASCGQGQSGPMWFLAGTQGGLLTRSCTVPKNKRLFFPLVNSWVIPTAEAVEDPADLASYLAFVQDYLPAKRMQTCELHLTLDGVAIGGDTTAEIDQKLWVQILDPFDVVVNDDNWASPWGRPGGFTPAATIAGHWALITPLTTGNHVLEFGGSLCDESDVVQFTTSAVYNLTVQ